jgi:hypothetical protein
MDLVFKPDRQRGIALHLGALLLNLAAVGFLVLMALSQSIRGFFILYLIGSLLVFFPVPLITYRLFALLRASYTIFREGVSLQWGLRSEVIPMQEIEWARMAEDMAVDLPLPGFSVQGAILGVKQHRDLGPIEYLASNTNSLVLIASRTMIYAISPANPGGFIEALSRNLELGSVEPIQPKTARADFLVGTLLADHLARNLILMGSILSILLLVAVSFIIPTRETIPLGFNPIGQTAETSPADRLLLLPIFSMVMLAADLALGSYLYRKAGYRIAAYFAYASSLVLPISFLGLIIFIVL